MWSKMCVNDLGEWWASDTVHQAVSGNKKKKKGLLFTAEENINGPGLYEISGDNSRCRLWFSWRSLRCKAERDILNKHEENNM